MTCEPDCLREYESSDQTALKRRDLPCRYLAHHEWENTKCMYFVYCVQASHVEMLSDRTNLLLLPTLFCINAVVIPSRLSITVTTSKLSSNLVRYSLTIWHILCPDVIMHTCLHAYSHHVVLISLEVLYGASVILSRCKADTSKANCSALRAISCPSQFLDSMQMSKDKDVEVMLTRVDDSVLTMCR